MAFNSDISAKFRRGNLDSLYDAFYRPLMMYAAKCLTDKFSFLAEDCVQDAIMQAYRTRDSFYSDPELRSYLYKTVHGKAVDILRKDNSKEKYTLSLSLATSDGIITDIVENESMNRLFKVLQQLPQADRDLFFDYCNGLKTSEIAVKLGLSESAVKQRKAKMISKIQEKMGPDLIIVVAMLSSLAKFPN